MKIQNFSILFIHSFIFFFFYFPPAFTISPFMNFFLLGLFLNEIIIKKGINVTMSQVNELISEFFRVGSDARTQLEDERYGAVPELLGKLRKHKILKWADGKDLKTAFDKEVLDIIGPKGTREEELQKTKKKSSAPSPVSATTPTAPAAATVSAATSIASAAEEEAPSYNKFIGRELLTAMNSKELIEQHNKITGGKVYTRFPPEPNVCILLDLSSCFQLYFSTAFI